LPRIPRVDITIMHVDFHYHLHAHSNLNYPFKNVLKAQFLSPAPRYSEDIDLVQIKPGPIKPVIKRIGEGFSFFEENRKNNNPDYSPRNFLVSKAKGGNQRKVT